MATGNSLITKSLVGLPGFEPGTSCTPSKRATRLRYNPNCWAALWGFPPESGGDDPGVSPCSPDPTAR